MADLQPGADAVVAEVSSALLRLVCAGLAVVLLVLAARRLLRPDGSRRWLAHAASALVLVALVDRALAPLWFVAFPLLVSVFPDGRFVPRWTVVPVLACAVPAGVELVEPGRWSDAPWWSWFAPGQLVLLGAQVHRYRRRASTEERESVRWVILGTLVTVACFALVDVGFPGEVGGGSGPARAAAALAVLPLALGIAAGAARPRRWDVDRALHLVVLGWLAVPVLAGLFAAVAAMLGTWAAAAAVAAATWPAGLLARRAADWLVYRGRPDVARTTRRMLAGLDRDGSADAVPAAVLDAAMDAARLDGGSISGTWFGLVRRGADGPSQDGGGGMTLPVTYRGEEVAVLRLPPRRGESELTPHDRRVLTSLAAHAAPALHGAKVLADLQESRSRLVSAREEERKRLRRELHDGLAPALSGLSLSAAALARTTGLPAATELHHDIQDVAAQTRDIAYDLRPPVLDDHGLVAAVLDRARGVPGPEVHVTAPDPLVLPAAVDLAALRIVTEAVTNSARHGGAGRVDVTVSVADGWLRLVVEDDGRGLPVDLRPGVGMHSIAERAAELGGSSRYERGSGGCRLAVDLPLEPHEEVGP